MGFNQKVLGPKRGFVQTLSTPQVYDPRSQISHITFLLRYIKAWVCKFVPHQQLLLMNISHISLMSSTHDHYPILCTETLVRVQLRHYLDPCLNVPESLENYVIRQICNLLL